jgi:kynurenine 3-monooxygenase
MNKKEHILIVGAGLCGSLLALRMAQRGFKITLVEKRPDLRKSDISAGRSINLAFSNRGIKGISLVGLTKKTEPLCIPMNGRMIHDKTGETFFSPYSGNKSEYINSISRTDLNALLLNEVEKLPNAEIIFQQDCKDVDLKSAKAVFEHFETKKKTELSGDILIGTDGAGSVVRQSMEADSDMNFRVSEDFLEHGYKELSIPAGKTEKYRIFKNALHIWPRGENMLIALPNLDGSFTVTLFMSYKKGEQNFEQLKSEKSIKAYFEEFYPDALEQMPDLIKDFSQNPTSPLGTVKCSPWNVQGKSLLMGDSAHAIVPFYGQGMNASFEDVVVFDEVLDDFEGNWQQIFDEYEKRRKKDTDAIGDLAIDNFHEMKEHTAAPVFQQKRKLETAFEQEFPDEFASKYRLVTFREQIGYNQAMQRGRAQDKAILKLLENNELSDSLGLKEKLEKVNQATKKMLDGTFS